VSDGRGGVYRVFLSSTAEDLKDHRSAVLAALAKLDDVKLVNQESFGARSAASTVEECRRLVKQSDIVVVVVAHRYGWVPTFDEGGDNKRSITMLELEAAESKPVLRFLVKEDYNWPYASEQDALTADDADPNEVKRRVRLLRISPQASSAGGIGLRHSADRQSLGRRPSRVEGRRIRD
jgi:hypothetical protein